MMNNKLSIEVKELILEFCGGKQFLLKRKMLTHISEAIDLFYSNYSDNSFWYWNEWRKRNGYHQLSKPEIPNRFRKIKNNNYIKSIDPPIINGNIVNLQCLHKRIRNNL